MMGTRQRVGIMVAGVVFLASAGKVFAASGFLSAGIETRCDVLRSFVDDLTRKDRAGWEVTDWSCGEGNGLGGARYNVDAEWKSKERGTFQVRLDLRENEDLARWQARVCDTAAHPEKCSSAAEPLPSKFSVLPPTIPKLAASVERWIGTGSVPKTIFGQPYEAFVRGIETRQGGFPIDDGREIAVTLEPKTGAPKGTPARGGIVVRQAPPKSFLECFECADQACLESEVHYEFKDRFLMLTRTIVRAEKDPAGASSYATVRGGGWLMEGSDPLSKERGKRWTFVCGISRYSLQKVSLPAQ